MTRPTIHPPIVIAWVVLPLSLSLFPYFLSLTQTDHQQQSMSTLGHLFDLPEQICYVQCGFCTTILMVSVPCSNSSMVVTVRCGRCASLLSVNMMKTSFVPLHLLASLSKDDEPQEEVCKEEADAQKTLNSLSPSIVTSSDNEEEDTFSVNHMINKPPEKRQRAPSAYNRFIKEEIRRLKAENPNMAHKEAFRTASKNWAHFPPIQYKGDGESCGQEEEKATLNSDATEVYVEANCNNGFRERKAPRRSILAKTPFE